MLSLRPIGTENDDYDDVFRFTNEKIHRNLIKIRNVSQYNTDDKQKVSSLQTKLCQFRQSLSYAEFENKVINDVHPPLVRH